MRKIFFPSLNPEFVNRRKVISSLKRISTLLIQKNIKIDKIYLFGSFATDSAGIHSDADILIVLKKDNRRMLDRLDEFILKFSDAPVPVDVLVYTQEELEEMLNAGNPFIRRIVQDRILMCAS